MPVSFLTKTQREEYGRYSRPPTAQELSRYFHLDDNDHSLIATKRTEHNRLGFAVQLCTLRYLGTFISDMDVPDSIIAVISSQLGLQGGVDLDRYRNGNQRWIHADEIRERYGFAEITEHRVAFVFSRWLYALCWTGTDRPSVLFERARYWLLSHKVILPGFSTLERFVAKVRSRVDARVWKTLVCDVGSTQRADLLALLTKESGESRTQMEKLRKGPVSVSAQSILHEIKRLDRIRMLHTAWQFPGHVPDVRVMNLARYASTAKASTIRRMSASRKIATLRALIASLSISAQDDILVVLEQLLTKIFNESTKKHQQKRQASLKAYDRSAAVLAKACRLILDEQISGDDLRARLYQAVSQKSLITAVDHVTGLIRPKNDVHFSELNDRYRTVRKFFPDLLRSIRFEANASGQNLIDALDWLRENLTQPKLSSPAPQAIVKKAWKADTYGEEEQAFNLHAYVFCVLSSLQASLKRRDIFVSPSWRYSDPRANLLAGKEWTSSKTMVCRALNLSRTPTQSLNSLALELDGTYKAVSGRLSENKKVSIETDGPKTRLILTPIDKVKEPRSLLDLRKRVASMMPRVDLPELILEVSARTNFTNAFTHISERSSRAGDIDISVCAVIMAEACNTGFEPLVKNNVDALKRDRLSWVSQNYIRNDTITEANASLVSEHTDIPLASSWGDGEIAAADGLRFVVPVKSVHAGPNPQYFSYGKGMTWYNLLSDQLSGLNDLPVPGTLRDSMSLLAVVLEQQTELQPTTIMTDTGAYSDVVFGLFRLLGYRFSPRLADIGDARLWRLDPSADYGELNSISTHKARLEKIKPHWEDILRLVGSLRLGRLSALDIMKTLQVGNKPTRLALAIAEYGRIDKTIHLLTYVDDEDKRHEIQKQLNRVEGRHSLAREIFHGKRGELRKHYREGQEDQLGSLGLVLNMVVYWNTLYMQAALDQLRSEGYPVFEADIERLSPLIHSHINMLGRYQFSVPDEVSQGLLRPLRDPNDKNQSP